ncbi:hypothetical protein GCM10007981_17450 [Thermocladium modestius]|uniref:Uncharacterized protein n=1 Tax=Thermocladium modestius TaxID=62609 RepID=A0A830GZD7_9CREN|nr:hypothetical protein GCM10007981_17450 [Thermocladium modestius]
MLQRLIFPEAFTNEPPNTASGLAWGEGYGVIHPTTGDEGEAWTHPIPWGGLGRPSPETG